jgi:multimeric flavodoxin WrbA
MNVVILNGSPRGARSITGKLLDSLARGLAAGGAAITEFKVANLNIAPCTACLSCMYRTPGQCATKDDMAGIYEHMKSADLLVMGTPVYTDNMSAQMKTVMDRCICSLQPFLRRDDAGRVRHSYWWRMPSRFLLVSTSGFPEVETFLPLIATFRAQAANLGSRPLGEVCIPGSIALQIEPSKMTHHLELLQELGLCLSRTGDVDAHILGKLNTPPLTTDEYLVLASAYEAWCREKLMKALDA